MEAPTGTGVGTSIIPIIALVVTVLVAFVAPLVTWAVAQRQIAVTAREAWKREFREQVAALFSIMAVYRDHIRDHAVLDPESRKRRDELYDALTFRWHGIRLLIAEKGQYAAFVPIVQHAIDSPTMEAAAKVRELYAAAEKILQCEQAAIATDPGALRALWASLGLRGWRQPRLRLRAWLSRDPPRFRDVPPGAADRAASRVMARFEFEAADRARRDCSPATG
jgi:hypothetical protein